MEEALRQDLIDKLLNIRKLGDDIRKTSGISCVESYMRFVDVNCSSALWHLGGIDFWEYEIQYDD